MLTRTVSFTKIVMGNSAVVKSIIRIIFPKQKTRQGKRIALLPKIVAAAGIKHPKREMRRRFIF